MLNLHNTCFKACLALSITLSSVAMAEPLAGFQFEAPLADGKASLRRAVLPSDVMLNLQQRNYADLVVVNAANQIVPSSVQMIDTQQETLTDLRSLAFFRSDDPQQLGTLLTLPQGDTKPDITQLIQPGRQYLIVHDANFSPDSLPLTRLRLDWSNLEQWLPKNLVLELSDDLIQWRPVAIKALPYVLKQQGNVLENREIVLQEPIHAPFIRLSGNADLAHLLNALTQVEGSFSKSVKTDTLQWGALPLNVDKDDARSFSVTIPRGLSATYWRMPNLSVGTMYVGEIEFFEEARPRFGQQAQAFQQENFRQYKLKTEAGELQADSSPVSDYWSNAWHLRFAQGSALPPANSNIELGWKPVEIRYVAQGQAPFRLAFGNPTANPTALVLDDALLQQTNAETVTVGKAVRVAEAPIVKDHTQLWTVALWGLLGLAVLLLLWMTRNLWREMQKNESTL